MVDTIADCLVVLIQDGNTVVRSDMSDIDTKVAESERGLGGRLEHI